MVPAGIAAAADQKLVAIDDALRQIVIDAGRRTWSRP
jgi:hypothetical protein